MQPDSGTSSEVFQSYRCAASHNDDSKPMFRPAFGKTRVDDPQSPSRSICE